VGNSGAIPEKGKGQSDFSDWPLFLCRQLEALRRRERAFLAKDLYNRLVNHAMSNFSLISAISFALLISACNRANSASGELRAGGLYSTEDGKGQFSVVKILVLEPDAVHIRIYKEVLVATYVESIPPRSP
jgi:hypothetical protein